MAWQLERRYLEVFTTVYDADLVDLLGGGSQGVRTAGLENAEEIEVRGRSGQEDMHLL